MRLGQIMKRKNKRGEGKTQVGGKREEMRKKKNKDNERRKKMVRKEEKVVCRRGANGVEGQKWW